MSSLSRRVVLQGASALGAVPFIKWSAAKAAAPATRYSAFSPEGKKALASYSKAVDAMVKRSEKDPTDPLGWIYQYKMHWYPDNGAQVLASGGFPALQQAQKAELDQFFGPPGTGNTRGAQAEATWGKCPHTLGRRGPLAVDFMPWHRMYLLFFERIVRKLSQDDHFTLPYWGYMDGKSSQIIPPEFTASAPNPLFHDRATAINHGGSMNELVFSGSFWDDSDFNVFTLAVEGTPHGAVHNIVGQGGKDMSNLFLSPKDPVFWLHHCEIDRIWEGALKAGFPTPGGTWLTQKHQFFDENPTIVELTNNDVLKTAQIGNWPGYVYHELPNPPATPAAALMAQPAQPQVRRTLATATNVELRGGLQTTSLAATPALTAMAAAPLSATGPRRLKLEISDVSLDRGAEANVALYLNPPSNAPAELLRNHLVGVLSTFAILPTPTNADHAGHGRDGPPAVYSFDVTRLIADLQKRGLWTGELKLASQEITGALGEASLKLGKVELVETSAGGTQQ